MVKEILVKKFETKYNPVKGVIEATGPTPALLAIPVGATAKIPFMDFASNNIRTAISELKAKGYDFTCTTAGHPDYSLVTRLA